MLSLRICNPKNTEFLTTFSAGWSPAEVEDWARDNNVDLACEYVAKLIEAEGSIGSIPWGENTLTWGLDEKDELCELLTSFSDGWNPDREKEKVLFLHLQNAKFDPRALSSFEIS